MGSLKLTKLEKYWILYDIGNSAFILLTATIIPIYFDALARQAGVSEVNYLAYWGYAASIATLLVAASGPLLGSFADVKGYKKPLFAASVAIGAIGCAALSLPASWVVFLGVFIVAKVGYSISLIFYDSMLCDVTEPDRMDSISSYGFAWGYIGSCIPFVASLAIMLFYQSMGITVGTAVLIAFSLNSAWWILSTVPLLKYYNQKHYEEPGLHPVKDSFIRLANTCREIKDKKHIFMFILAFFFYIDGVYTIIDMAAAYGSALGLAAPVLLLALLLTQIVAFPFSVIFGRAAAKYNTASLIRASIIAYICITLFAVQLNHQWEFWVLAVCVGMFQGTVQALSRSYFAKIIPPEKAGEYFGIFDICGKGASFMGTALIGVFAQITGSPNGGVAILAVMFLIGLLLFNKAVKLNMV